MPTYATSSSLSDRELRSMEVNAERVAPRAGTGGGHRPLLPPDRCARLYRRACPHGTRPSNRRRGDEHAHDEGGQHDRDVAHDGRKLLSPPASSPLRGSRSCGPAAATVALRPEDHTTREKDATPRRRRPGATGSPGRGAPPAWPLPRARGPRATTADSCPPAAKRLGGDRVLLALLGNHEHTAAR